MSENHSQRRVFPETTHKEFGDRYFLGSIRFSARFWLFALVGVAFAALAGGGYFLAEKKLNEAETALAAAKSLTEAAGTVEKKIWRIRELEKTLLDAPAPEAIAGHEAAVASTLGLLNGLYKRPDVARARETISTISEGLDQYIAETRALVAAGRALDGGGEGGGGLLRRLQGAGKGVTAGIAGVKKLKPLAALATGMRRFEKAFVMDGSAQDLAAIEKLSAEIATRTAKIRASKKIKGGITALMKTYRDTLAAVAENIAIRNKGLTRLDEIHTYLAPSIESFSAFAKDKAATSKIRLNELKKISRWALPALAAGLVAALTLFGLILMRSIAVPVRSISKAAALLMGGESSVPIPAIGNNDETGDLARALANLKASLAGASLLRRDLEAKIANAEDDAQARAEVTRLGDDLIAAKARAEKGEAALSETIRLRNELAEARTEAAKGGEVERMREELEALKTEAERGEAAVIEAALLRMDLDATKAELDKASHQAATLAAERTAQAASRADEDSQAPQTHEKNMPGSLSTISEQVALSSRSVTEAAREAERTGALIRGLSSATERILEAEKLVGAIGDFTDPSLFPAPRPEGRQEGKTDGSDNLVVLAPEHRQGPGKDETGRRIETIRTSASQAAWAIRDAARTIDQLRDIAVDIAQSSSAEALAVTTKLLEQSEHLREMLDTMVTKIQSPSEEQGGPATPPREADRTPSGS